MTHSILDDVALWVQQHLLAFFGPAFDYLYLGGWYTVFVVTLVVCGVIGYFLPFQWVRAFLGFIVWSVGMAVVGAQIMFNHEHKRKPPPPPPEPKRREWDRW